MDNNKYYKKILECVKRTSSILEIAYEGNIGIHEVMRFFQMANPDQVREFELLMAGEQVHAAWELVQRVVGVNLKGF